MQPVGELDQDDPDVLGHRDHHLAVVLGLAVVAALEGDARELGHAVHELGDLLAELVSTSSSDALVSSTVSCRSAAQSVAVSSRMPAQILATPTGCTMKSSPLARRWSAWRSQANTNAFSTSSRSTCLGGLVGVLLDHGEQVAEQHALVVGELGLRAGGVATVLVVRVLVDCG